eukprot:GILK01007875.1.p1 GENE.GILK01007875.1~~GILK01007875.1.p1  ORF type:complete len:1396 (+),score=316.89 GILK01007875.1:569-4189(+)
MDVESTQSQTQSQSQSSQSVEDEDDMDMDVKPRLSRLRKRKTVTYCDDDDEDENTLGKLVDETAVPVKKAKADPSAITSVNTSSRKRSRRMAGGAEDESSEEEYMPSKMEEKEEAAREDEDMADAMTQAYEDVSDAEHDDEDEDEGPKKRRRKAGAGAIKPAARNAPRANVSAKTNNNNNNKSKTPVKKSNSTGGLQSTPKDTKMASAGAQSPSNNAPLDEDGNLMAPANINFEQPYWITPEKIKDAKGRRPGDLDYDPTTLLVPFRNEKFTPAMQQWWEVKAQHWDKIVFFKVGKFYELFYDDAVVCQRLLDLNWMGDAAGRPHVGFPEKVLDKYAAKLVDHQYKVLVVEQMETPAELAERNRSTGSKDKAVKREVCQVLTKGTLVDPSMIGGAESRYLLSLRQNSDTINERRFGVCFVDTSTCTFYISELPDDQQMSALRTLLSQIRPAEVIFEKGELDSSVLKMVKACPLPPLLSPRQKTTFWDANTTKEELLNNYLEGKKWPEAFETVGESELCMSALGGCIAYLKDVLLDKQVVSMGLFRVYDPAVVPFRALVLDSQALINLEILENNTDGTLNGSLLSIVDHTVTAFGKRMFRRWLCAPLCDVTDINSRLDAVEDFMSHRELKEKLKLKLSKLPDLERTLARIYSHSLQQQRGAVYFEDVNQSKMKDFFAVLDSLQATLSIIGIFDEYRSDLKSDRLKRLTTVASNGGAFPEISEALNEFREVIEMDIFRRDGTIVPHKGVDPEYDEAQAEVAEIEELLQDELREVRSRLGEKNIHFVKIKYPFELEIPAHVVNGNKRPKDFELTSTKQGYDRFHTPAIKALVTRYEQAEQAVKDRLIPFLATVFSRFHTRYPLWSAACLCVAEIDCLLSLSIASNNWATAACRPTVLPAPVHEAPFMCLKNMTHPYIKVSGGGSFIPNDTILGRANEPLSNDSMELDNSTLPTQNYDDVGENGCGGPRFLLVTGPNMGGKSTLLRQSCLAVILAQLGCYVPASEFRFTVVDRIFTRIGASDNILEGKSTFMMELEETANILRNASIHSLVIMDELGRGTSTFDGTALAFAVLIKLARDIKCRTLFSTHYHMLTEEFMHDSMVGMYHMACQVDSVSQRVTFLYKFIQGACPKSYGMNVAALAGLPDSVVQRAREMSEQFEERLQQAHGTSPKSTMVLGEAEWKAAVEVIYGYINGSVSLESLSTVWRSLQ